MGYQPKTKRWHLEIRDNVSGKVEISRDVSVLIYAAMSGDELFRGTFCAETKFHMKVLMKAMLEELETAAKAMFES